jgi:hypothetical protein
MKVIKPFLEVLKTFDFHQVHNMLALMLDPHLKSLWLWKVLWGVKMQFTSLLNMIINVNAVIPLLMKGWMQAIVAHFKQMHMTPKSP